MAARRRRRASTTVVPRELEAHVPNRLGHLVGLGGVECLPRPAAPRLRLRALRVERRAKLGLRHAHEALTMRPQTRVRLRREHACVPEQEQKHTRSNCSTLKSAHHRTRKSTGGRAACLGGRDEEEEAKSPVFADAEVGPARAKQSNTETRHSRACHVRLAVARESPTVAWPRGHGCAQALSGGGEGPAVAIGPAHERHAQMLLVEGRALGACAEKAGLLGASHPAAAAAAAAAATPQRRARGPWSLRRRTRGVRRAGWPVSERSLCLCMCRRAVRTVAFLVAVADLGHWLHNRGA